MSELAAEATLRVLVVSASEGAQEEVRARLAGWARPHRVYWVAQPDLASARAQELLPQAIVVDDALAGAHMVALIRELSGRLPGAAVVALVGEEAIAEARQAVLAGARGFLTKPLRGDELAATLEQVLGARRPAGQAQAAEAATGRTVVFCAPKGGTGRTTLTLNTAISLHLATKAPVVLVDADYSAPALDVALNLHTERNVTDLLPRLSRLDEELVAGVLVPHASGIQVLLAPPPADLTHPISLPQVQQILVLLKRMFPWVMVDLGLPLDETAFAFLDGADRIVMTVLPEMVGLRNTRLMLDQLLERGYPEEKVWLLLNRATMRGGVGAGEIEQRLGLKLAHRVPDDQPLATHSINRGVPLVVSHRRSAVARAVRQLVRQLIEAHPNPVEPGEQDKARGRGAAGPGSKRGSRVKKGE